MAHKTVSVFLFVFIFQGDYSALYGLFHLIMGVILLENFITKLPFFNDQVSQIYGMSISIYVWVNSCLIFVQEIALDMLETMCWSSAQLV